MSRADQAPFANIIFDAKEMAHIARLDCRLEIRVFRYSGVPWGLDFGVADPRLRRVVNLRCFPRPVVGEARWRYAISRRPCDLARDDIIPHLCLIKYVTY